MPENEVLTPTTKEALDAVKAINELQKLFMDSAEILAKIMPLFHQAVAGEPVKWFEGCGKVGDLSQDDAQGCVIVAASILAKIKAALVAGTPAEQIMRDNFKVDG